MPSFENRVKDALTRDVLQQQITAYCQSVDEAKRDTANLIRTRLTGDGFNDFRNDVLKIIRDCEYITSDLDDIAGVYGSLRECWGYEEMDLDPDDVPDLDAMEIGAAVYEEADCHLTVAEIRAFLDFAIVTPLCSGQLSLQDNLALDNSELSALDLLNMDDFQSVVNSYLTEYSSRREELILPTKGAV